MEGGGHMFGRAGMQRAKAKSDSSGQNCFDIRPDSEEVILKWSLLLGYFGEISLPKKWHSKKSENSIRLISLISPKKGPPGIPGAHLQLFTKALGSR